MTTPAQRTTWLADEAVIRLYENGMFQEYPDAHVYGSMDGLGYLFLELSLLETRKQPDLPGLGF